MARCLYVVSQSCHACGLQFMYCTYLQSLGWCLICLWELLLFMHLSLLNRWLLGVVCGVTAASAWAQTSETEDTSARYQLTYNWQRHGAFNAAYSGTNSIAPTAEKMYTFSTTAHWGFRPWQDGELYFNPEITQGMPFSGNLVGLGGFTNGEITRAGGNNPKLYRQRLFVRQTWNRGGGTEMSEAGANQLAGSVDRNRVVLTAGNFSTLDVFDNNAYAKDPRTQFMNWGSWTYAAYDYAADSRGFGWGAALEWYQDAWAFRVGRMTGPKEPNGLPVDFALGKHYGDQLEVEREHVLGGQPGKVRMLWWHNRAVLARYDDATQWQLANPGVYADPRALVSSRTGEQDKHGLGLNIERDETGGEGPNGVLIEVSEAELERLALREIRYRRVDVTWVVASATRAGGRSGSPVMWRTPPTASQIAP